MKTFNDLLTEIERVGNLSIPQLRDEWCMCTVPTYTKRDVKRVTENATRGELIAGIIEGYLSKQEVLPEDELP